MKGQGFGISGACEVDAAPFLKRLQESGMIARLERSPEEALLLAKHRKKLTQLNEAAALSAKERTRVVLSRLMPSATVTAKGDEFEVEFKDDDGANQVVAFKIMDSTVAEKEAGFDLTYFGDEKAIDVWAAMGLDTKPVVSKERSFVWVGDGLEVVASNNPFVGPPLKVGESAIGKKGYAGYIGVRGKKARVAQAIKAIKKYGDYKEFVDGVLAFIGFPEA